MKNKEYSLCIQNNKYIDRNKGFTLVELIVVLLILAILSAILIPALLGYIDSAKDKKDMLAAKNCLTAIQAELVNCYAKHSTDLGKNNNYDITGENTNTNLAARRTEDVNIPNTTNFVNNILDKLDSNPYCVVFATGCYGENKVTLHDCYTVCFVYYQETKDSAPLYYYNDEWTKRSPRAYINGKDGDKFTDVINNNTFQTGKWKGKKIRYYLLINNTDWKNFTAWDKFGLIWKNLLEKHNVD